MIAGSEQPLTSEAIANSVGTNPSYIRKIAGLLKNAHIIDSRQGRSGFVLTLSPEELTLWQVYCAAEETDQIHLFDIHRNPNDECIVGRHIQPTLSAMFSDIESTARREMNAKTLRDCMNDMQTRIKVY
jgi:DNA-binding IscR family transcriptional regulator